MHLIESRWTNWWGNTIDKMFIYTAIKKYYTRVFAKVATRFPLRWNVTCDYMYIYFSEVDCIYYVSYRQGRVFTSQIEFLILEKTKKNWRKIQWIVYDLFKIFLRFYLYFYSCKIILFFYIHIRRNLTINNNCQHFVWKL